MKKNNRNSLNFGLGCNPCSLQWKGRLRYEQQYIIGRPKNM